MVTLIEALKGFNDLLPIMVVILVCCILVYLGVGAVVDIVSWVKIMMG